MVRFLRWSFVCLSLTAGVAPLNAARRQPVWIESNDSGVDPWSGVTSDHFILVSRDTPDAAKAELQRLETAFLFFDKAGFVKSGPVIKLKVIAFNSEREYNFYRISPGAYAFYQRTWSNDYIVIRSLDPARMEVPLHEYTHFIVEHSGFKLPLWLNEGLADLYSTITPRGDEVLVGKAPNGRLDYLDGKHRMDFDTLGGITQESPYYQDPDRMLRFYAESWSLTHLLALDPRYGGGFRHFLEALSSGLSLEKSLDAVYHKSLEDVHRDWEQYAHGRMPAMAFPFDLQMPALQTITVANPDQEAQQSLAEILAVNARTANQGQASLTSLAARYPDGPAAEEALGYLSLRNRDEAGALIHFQRAVDRDSKNPDVVFHFAHLELTRQGASPAVVSLLERVLQMDPAHYSAKLDLGFAAAKLGLYDVAAKALVQIPRVLPEHEYVVDYTLAFCYANLNQSGRARQYGERARQVATGRSDQAEVAGLLRFIERRSPDELATR